MKSIDEKHPKVTVSSKGAAAEQKPKNPDNWRETIESIVVAFVLAFLFRTFEAEAFVIPTGSMAPTLYGQQRDVTCAHCGTRFAAGVSSVPANDAELRDNMIVARDRSHFAICPNANCRFPNDILEHEMFAGDRILVNKFPYEFNNPQRWDVVVFKFPEQAKTNYIKRLAGLPGEELRLEDGDVKVRPIGASDQPYRVARKTPEKQRQLQLLVHDNDRPARALLETGWPESWAREEPSAWAADSKTRSFRVDPDATDSEAWHWLKYTHYLPRAEDWTLALAGKPPSSEPQPEYIRDFYAYNSRITVEQADNDLRNGRLPNLHVPSNDPDQWVGDLTLTCRIEILASGGELTIELVEARRQYRCTIDLASGQGRFVYFDMDPIGEDPRPAGDPFETVMNRPGKYAVSFANVDDRLCLWIDDRLVKSLEFEPESKFEPQISPVVPGHRDKTPVGIAARMAKLRVDHLRIERDIFYRHEPGGMATAHETKFTLHKDEADPRNDEFLMLGDNSPRSNDSRLWAPPHSVPRHLLIGKAFFVYWPHGVPFLNGGRGFPIGKYSEPNPRDGSETNPPLPKFSLPFYPQVGRMHRIR